VSRRFVFTALALAAGAGAGALLIGAGEASAITRSEVLSRAKTFAYHPWTCTSQNLTGSCGGGYQSVYVPGDYVGLPYDWGGYMSMFEFDQGILNGKGAGSYPDDGILSCTVGVDCSGFVSKAWDTGHYTTSNLADISSAIAVGSLLPGDVFNEAGYHVAMFSHSLAGGEPAMYESLGYNVHYNVTGGWSHVDGYIPRRFTKIEGTQASPIDGTPVDPIVIDGFPYTDMRNTKESESDLLDGCGAAPSKSEAGPEYVYQVTFDQPGTLAASISDDVGVDIDIHLYTSMNTSDCVARNDTTLTVEVDCGTYYIVTDTFKGATETPGLFTLTATFAPANKPCGNGPPAYSPSGKLGDACGNPNAPALPFCNPNVGGEVCLYNDDLSFCTKPCAVNADCGQFPGGCCGDLGGGELYCFAAELCGGNMPPDQMDNPDGGDPSPGDLTSGSAGAGGSAGGPAGVAGGSAGAGGQGGAGGPTGGKTTGSGSNPDDPDNGGGCSSSSTAPRGGGTLALLLGLAGIVATRRKRPRS